MDSRNRLIALLNGYWRRFAPARLDGADNRSDTTRGVIFTLVMLGVSALCVAVDWRGGEITYVSGDVASETLKSPITTSYVSDLRTEQLRREAYEDDRHIVESLDDSIRPGVVDTLRRAESTVETLRDDDRELETRAAELRAELEGLSASDAALLLDVSDAAWSRIGTEALRLVDETLQQQVRQNQVARLKEDLPQMVSDDLAVSEQLLAVALARPYIRSNVIIDAERTEANRQRASEAVQPSTVSVQAGQAVLRDGDVITDLDVEKLEHVGLLDQGSSATTRFGRSGLMVGLALTLVIYLFRFHQPLWRQRKLLLVALLYTGPLIAAALLLPHDEIQYMFPAAAAAMLLAVLIDAQLAVVTGAILSLSLGVVSDMQMWLAVLYLVSCVAGAILLIRAERTTTFVWAGVAVAVASFGVGICLTAINGDVSTESLVEIGLEAAVNGALSASLTFLSFSLLGSLFGITTHLQLLELAHPNQPLLYRLAREAPGTYHHSIVVSNLAESAIEIVGGDPLFARVAVLYHDIGKITRPTFFVENQAHRDNPHDLLDPDVSARVIIDHVLDGVALARKHNMPPSMVDIIQQHHGTSTIRYFLARARAENPDVDESAFRYPGPRPQTKEAGVIMLADSVEAAVRSAATSGRLVGRNSTAQEPVTITSIVASVVQEKLDDDQLVECDLTLREIHEIKRSFVQMLDGIYHPRVEYPPLTARSTAQTGVPVA